MTNSKQKGLIKAIIMVVIALIMLSFMGIDLEKAVAEPLFKKNLQFTGEVIKSGWDKLMGLVSKKSDASTKSTESGNESLDDIELDDIDLDF